MRPCTLTRIACPSQCGAPLHCATRGSHAGKHSMCFAPPTRFVRTYDALNDEFREMRSCPPPAPRRVPVGNAVAEDWNAAITFGLRRIGKIVSAISTLVLYTRLLCGQKSGRTQKGDGCRGGGRERGEKQGGDRQMERMVAVTAGRLDRSKGWVRGRGNGAAGFQPPLSVRWTNYWNGVGDLSLRSISTFHIRSAVC